MKSGHEDQIARAMARRGLLSRVGIGMFQIGSGGGGGRGTAPCQPQGKKVRTLQHNEYEADSKNEHSTKERFDRPYSPRKYLSANRKFCKNYGPQGDKATHRAMPTTRKKVRTLHLNVYEADSKNEHNA